MESWRNVPKAFDKDGATSSFARRVDGRSDLWELHVKPRIDDTITVTLPGHDGCTGRYPLCTVDRRAVADDVTIAIPGPDEALTGALVLVPEHDDKESTAKLNLNLPISGGFRTVQNAVEVAGGSLVKLVFDSRKIKPVGSQ